MSTKEQDIAFYNRVQDIEIAIRKTPGRNNKAGIMWFGGYRTSMLSTKPSALAEYARERDISFVRWDYSGHGESAGDCFKGNLSIWLEQALHVYQNHANHPTILVGSSLGGWISLALAQMLKAKRLPQPIFVVLIAPAPDFTTELLEPSLTGDEQQFLQERGFVVQPNQWKTLMPFTKNFIENSHQHLLFKDLIQIDCPVHILHGMKDEIIPFSHILKLMEHLPTENTSLTTVADGDHRLSRPEDVRVLYSILDNIYCGASIG